MANKLFIHRPPVLRPSDRMIGAMFGSGVLVALSLVLQTAPPAFADSTDPSQVVTTDTAQWCTWLSAKMDREQDASFDAIALGEQGKELCAKGYVRAGIERLRRALMTAHDEDGEDDVTIPSDSTREVPDTPSGDQRPTVVGNDGDGEGSVFFPAPPAFRPPANPGFAAGGPPPGLPPPGGAGGPGRR